MARITRIALDFALVSIKTIRPAVSRLWRGSKSYILETSAKRLVDNNLVTRAEHALHDATENLETKLTTLRDNQLPKEVQYLEKELQKAKEKMKKDNVLTAKAVKPAIGTAWQYAKIEMAPPLTVAYFTGRGGRKIEELASKTANNLIAGLEAMVRDMEAERLRQIRLKEEAVKAAQEKLKEEARIAREKAEKTKLSSSKQLGKSKVTKKRAKKVDTKPKAKAKAKGKGKGKPKRGKKPKRGGKT